MKPHIRIDFVSDVSCPWCAIGLGGLLQALARTADTLQASLQFQPFELNPHMAPGGQDIGEHLTEKYGSTPEQQAQIRDTIRQRGAEVGFVFHEGGRGRIYNTFDAHRLLHWAGLDHGATEGGAPGSPAQARQLALKQALLRACHGERQAMDEHAVLLAAVRSAGLDVAEATDVLAQGRHAEAVRAAQAEWAQAGIRSVPAVVLNRRHLVSGGQPAEVFEQVLRQVAAQAG
jgi:predicted DsbA family dithiol-disulfide isomerase